MQLNCVKILKPYSLNENAAKGRAERANTWPRFVLYPQSTARQVFRCCATKHLQTLCTNYERLTLGRDSFCVEIPTVGRATISLRSEMKTIRVLCGYIMAWNGRTTCRVDGRRWRSNSWTSRGCDSGQLTQFNTLRGLNYYSLVPSERFWLCFQIPERLPVNAGCAIFDPRTGARRSSRVHASLRVSRRPRHVPPSLGLST